MAIDFPNSPSNGDIYTVSGKRWQWDGEKWLAYGASLAATRTTGKNIIINGDMRVSQRAQTYTVATGGGTRYYPCDRFWTGNYT